MVKKHQEWRYDKFIYKSELSMSELTNDTTIEAVEVVENQNEQAEIQDGEPKKAKRKKTTKDTDEPTEITEAKLGGIENQKGVIRVHNSNSRDMYEPRTGTMLIAKSNTDIFIGNHDKRIVLSNIKQLSELNGGVLSVIGGDND